MYELSHSIIYKGNAITLRMCISFTSSFCVVDYVHIGEVSELKIVVLNAKYSIMYIYITLLMSLMFYICFIRHEFTMKYFMPCPLN